MLNIKICIHMYILGGRAGSRGVQSIGGVGGLCVVLCNTQHGKPKSCKHKVARHGP